MRIFLISDNVDTRTGLRLVGVDGAVVHTREEFAGALDTVMRDKDIAILIIVEKLAHRFPEMVNEIRFSSAMPLVVEIPDRHGTGRRKDFLTQYVKEAIGVQLG